MQFKFTTTAEVASETYSSKWKIVLTIGIVLFALIMVMEFLINGDIAWNFIFPIALLICARGKVGVKTSLQEIDGLAQKDKSGIRIVLYDAVKNKKGVFNRVLLLDGLNFPWYWDPDCYEFVVKGTGKIEIVNDDNLSLISEPIEDKWLYFYLDEEYADLFKQLFLPENEIRGE